LEAEREKELAERKASEEWQKALEADKKEKADRAAKEQEESYKKKLADGSTPSY